MKSIVGRTAPALLGLVFLAAGSAPATPVSAQQSGGTTINVLVEGGGYGSQYAIAKAFEIATGNTVNFIQVPYDGVHDKFVAEMASRAGSIDVATVDVVWLPEFQNALTPLDDLFTPDVQADLFPSLVSDAQANGHFIGMPAWANTEILFYRKDLFSDPTQQANFKAQFGYDLQPPATWQQYIDAAQFFTQKDASGQPSMYGTALTGAEDTDLELLALAAGSPGVVLDSNGKSIISNSAHQQALQFLSDLSCKYRVTAPNPQSEDWNATQALLNAGKVAEIFFWGHNYRQIPADAPAFGKIGMAPMIAGSAGIAGIPGPWYNVVPASSKNQEVAKAFVQFQYDHQDVALAPGTLGLVARQSAFASVQDQPGFENVTPLLKTLAAPATRGRPLVTDWTRVVSDVVIPTVQSAVSCNTSPSDALAAADQQLRATGH